MEHGHHRTDQKCTLIILKLQLIIRWAILENIFCMHTAHTYLPPTHLFPVTDTLMSTVSYWEVKTLGRKNLLLAVTLTATVGLKHVSSLVLRQQLEVLIYGVPSPHSVLLQKRDISIPNSQPAIRAPPQVLLVSLGESVQFTA